MPMDAARGSARRPSSAAAQATADPRRAAAAREAMARMEEVMLAHAGAAGEFSIILDAPLPSLQRYRRNPTPPTGASGSSPLRRAGPQGAGARDEVTPARLRREGSIHDAIGDADAARSRRGADAGAPTGVSGGAAGVRRARAAGAHGGVRGEGEEVEAPVRLGDLRSVRRASGRGNAPPARVAEVKPESAASAAVEEEQTPLQLLAQGGRSSSATRRVEAPQEVKVEAVASRPSSRRSRLEGSGDAGVKAVVAEPAAVEVEAGVESVGWWSSRGSEDGGEEAVVLLAPVVNGGRSRSNSPAISRNGVDSGAANRPQATGISTFAPPVGANVRSLQAVEMPNGTPRERRIIYPDPTFAQSTRSRDLHDSSTILEELEMLKDENVTLLEKLGLEEEKFRQSEARTRELEKQVANLGDGLSMEVKLMKRREEMLVRKEQEIRKALISKNGRSEEITTLQQQLQSAREEAAAAVKKLKEAEYETKSLRTMTHRMILSKEEMEEVVLKRCWLARYWGLAVQYGIYPDISMSKHEYWSSFAPLPFEYVTSAGQRGSDGLEDTDKLVHDLTVTAGEGNIETMLAVDKGLKELAFLKVEDAVLIALAQHCHPNVSEPADPDIKSSGDEKFNEAFDLSKEEEEDVLFKQAWLIYFWRRAKIHNVEEDIAEERLQMWIDRHGQQPTSHDAVDVEQGLHELRKLGIEQLLWEFSRQEVNTTNGESSDVEDLT